MPDGAQLLKRYKALQEDAQQFFNRWEELARFVAPSRTGIITDGQVGQNQGTDVYDSTMMGAADIAARFLAGELTNPATKWFGLRETRDDINGMDEVREWIEESRDRMLMEFDRSNFYSQVFELYVDFQGFGTASIFVSEKQQPIQGAVRGFRGLHFEADRIGRYVISQGADGRIDTEMREFKLSARAAVDKWGEAAMPESVRTAIKNGKPDTMFKFVHSVYPRPGAERRAGAKGMPFASCYVETESKQVVLESGFEEFPFMVPRFTVTPGESYGRGPGEMALHDQQTLNTAKRMGLEDWALKIRPPVLVAHDSVIGGTIRLRPAAPTAVRTNGRNIREMIAPFETGSHPEVSQIKEEELRRAIRQIYMVEQILAMLQVDKPEMTAFEYREKLSLLFRLLGPAYGNLQWEFLQPTIDRCFSLMYRQGAFSPPPDILLEQGGDFTIEFHNPISRAQKLGEVEAIQATITDLAPLVQVDPQIMDIFDTDKAARKVAEIRGVPATVVRSEDEVAQIRESRAAEQQRQQQLAEEAATAEAAGKAAPMLKVLQGQQPAGAAA